MTSLLVSDSTEPDLDHIFEETLNKRLDLSECLDAVKKLLDGTQRGTKASQYYFTMWSTLGAVEHLMGDMARYNIASGYLKKRLDIMEAAFLLLHPEIKKDKITDYIIEVLKKKKYDGKPAAEKSP